ncbi:PadR family transcriptional regulator [Frankia sp. Cpl3]|uniref:PadR family transcriptional regulator n=1 Tax=Parafrankia colletiae TaxID=573497 RepID=UPI0009FD3695|nr:PadR family transcriptional regulator [Parafrankia colletiae]MCK9899485.1 PadR family transcriptional regulator [Frankia sp. Cpl3]
MTRRRMSNPLALAVLALLNERPMHPYEISTTLRGRRKQDSIKLNFGSLYTVVEALERAGHITATATVRAGRRPERTIYAITDSGRTELDDWMVELVSTPMKEYTRFEAALSLLPVLPASEVVGLLRERRQRLLEDAEAAKATGRLAKVAGLPHIFRLEGEYVDALRDAELRYVDELITALVERTLDGIELWDVFHADPARPEETTRLLAAAEERIAEGRWAALPPSVVSDVRANAQGRREIEAAGPDTGQGEGPGGSPARDGHPGDGTATTGRPG